MVIYVNSKNEIKDVGSTSDSNLIPLTIIDNDDNPFVGWSVAKICCHRAKVIEGHVELFVPYVDVKIIEHIENLGKGNEANENNITNNQIAIAETYEKMLTTDITVTDIQLAITALYEMMLGGM